MQRRVRRALQKWRTVAITLVTYSGLRSNNCRKDRTLQQERMQQQEGLLLGNDLKGCDPEEDIVNQPFVVSFFPVLRS